MAPFVRSYADLRYSPLSWCGNFSEGFRQSTSATLLGGKSWEQSLPFAEFSYNNSFQSSLGRAPFEVLYDRKCRTPLNWSETGERQLFGPDIIQDAEEKVRIIREHLKKAQARQKSYYDKHHKEMVYQVGEKAYLKVSPLRGVRRFRIKGKLAPRYVGPFPIIAKRGELSYQLELPAEFPRVHDVFHVSQLRRCFKDPIRGVDHQILDLQPDLSYREHPIRILGESERKTRRKTPSSSKSNGLIIPKLKQPGNEKIVYDLSTLPFSDRKSTRLNSSHSGESRMPSSA